MRREPRTDPADGLAERYRQVMDRVAAAAARSGRQPRDVFVVAVSKYADMDQVRELIRLGHRDFGESRALQLAQRAAMIDELMGRRRVAPTVAGAALNPAHAPTPDSSAGATSPTDAVRWHMIGHLQRNKVKKIIGLTRLIHSVDSLRLVEEIQAIAFKRDEPVEVLVQVNCSGERNKHGCAVAAAAHLCEQIDTMIHLRVRGLMTMAPYSENPEDSRYTFERCREVFDDIRARSIGGDAFNILSMGMTGDFEVGIECGANLVRIGSAIFGDRPPAADLEQDDDED